MASRNELDRCYMEMAISISKLSKANRLKVGAVLVLESGVVVPSVNGMPKQFGNDCEVSDGGVLITKPEVIHAEEQCYNKCSLEGVSSRNSILYCTHSCCRHCSSRIVAAGTTEFVYLGLYRDESGLDNLRKAGIIVRKYGE